MKTRAVHFVKETTKNGKRKAVRCTIYDTASGKELKEFTATGTRADMFAEDKALKYIWGKGWLDVDYDRTIGKISAILDTTLEEMLGNSTHTFTKALAAKLGPKLQHRLSNITYTAIEAGENNTVGLVVTATVEPEPVPQYEEPRCYPIITLDNKELEYRGFTIPSKETMVKLASQLRKYYHDTYGQVLSDMAKSIRIKRA